jgi:hypothetical protein
MSDKDRSSCMARSCRSRLSVSDSRTVISAIHFSAIAIHQNKKAHDTQARRQAKLAMPARRSLSSCCLALDNRAVGGSDKGPINIRPKFFAANDATRKALYRDAMLERHTPINPLRNGTRSDAERLRKRALASDNFCCMFDCVHHASKFSRAIP